MTVSWESETWDIILYSQKNWAQDTWTWKLTKMDLFSHWTSWILFSYIFTLPNTYDNFFHSVSTMCIVHTFFFIHLNHTKIHKVNYHPCFSHKETEGHRVHTTSKIARIWTDSALSTTALSVHKTLLWPSTVWTTFKFQKCLFLPFFLYFPVSLKSSPYLENFNLSFQCLLKYGLLWFSWAWPWELLLLNAFYTSYFCHGHVHQSTC